MTWVKICGTTNLEDALIAVDAGADAVGFVFCEKSPRNISAERAREIVKKLPAEVEKVGVFVDADCDRIRQAVGEAGLTAVQLHGKRSSESVWQDQRPAPDSIGVSKIIEVISGDALKNGTSGIDTQVREQLFAVLLDSQAEDANGGTGRTFDWEGTRGIVRNISLSVPVIVAGGLTASNVVEALHTFQPFGVDVASGVEVSAGKKDPQKVRAFVRAVREIEEYTS